VQHEDEFTTAGGGLVWNDVAGKVDVTFDYTYAKSQGAIETVAVPASAAGAFPDLETELNSLRVTASYDVNERLRVGVAWTWEDYDSSDWQIAGVEPATLPGLLSMSPDPYKYSVNVIGLSFQLPLRRGRRGAGRSSRMTDGRPAAVISRRTPRPG